MLMRFSYAGYFGFSIAVRGWIFDWVSFWLVVLVSRTVGRRDVTK